MADPKQRIQKIYDLLSQQKIKNFPASAEEFGQRLDDDPNLSYNIFNMLNERGDIKSLPKDHLSFRSGLGLKKKEDGLSPSGSETSESGSELALEEGASADPGADSPTSSELKLPSELQALKEKMDQGHQMASDGSELQLERPNTEQELEEGRQAAREADPIQKGVDDIYGSVNDKFIPQFQEEAQGLVENATNLYQNRLDEWQKNNPDASEEELNQANTNIQNEVNEDLGNKIKVIESKYQKFIDDEAQQTVQSFLGIEKAKAAEQGPSRLSSALGEFARPFYKIPGTLIKGAGVLTP